MTMAVNDADDADNNRKHLVIDGIGKPPQENASQSPSNDRVAQRRAVKSSDCLVNRLKKALSCRR